MRRGELAERVGVHPETVRYYERRGLLSPPPRSQSGYRDYPESAVRILQFIKRAQHLGFTLDDVSELLRLAKAGPGACGAAVDVATARLDQVTRKLEDLQRARTALADLIARCDDPRAEPGCSLLHALQQDPDTASGPGTGS